VSALSSALLPTFRLNSLCGHGSDCACAHCDKDGSKHQLKQCSGCGVARYCDKRCQQWHWLWHKDACQRWRAQLPHATPVAPSDLSALQAAAIAAAEVEQAAATTAASAS